MLSFLDRRTLRSAQSVSTEDLCLDLQVAVTEAARAITQVGELTTRVSTDCATDGITEAQLAAFRSFAALTIASFRRFADDCDRNSPPLARAF